MELTPWQLIFINSKVNGAPYFGEDLPRMAWDWPRETWFKKRREELKEQTAGQDFRKNGGAR